MSRTILDPQYANDLNGLFDGTSDITASTITVTDGITIEAGGLTLTEGGITLSEGGITLTNGDIDITGNIVVTGTTGTLSVTSISAEIVNVTDIFSTLGSITCVGIVSSGAVDVAGNIDATGTLTTSGTVTCAGVLSSSAVDVIGACNATSFTGGIGMVVLTAQATGTLAPQGGVVFQLVEIPNFVGSATSAYVVSNNTVPAIPYLPFTFYVNFISTSSGNTYVDVTVINCSSTLSYSASIDFSVIAMN